MVTTPIMPERAVTRARATEFGRYPSCAIAACTRSRVRGDTRPYRSQRETPSDARHRPIEPRPPSTEDDRCAAYRPPPVCVPFCSHPKRNAQTAYYTPHFLINRQTFILITENRGVPNTTWIKVQETQMASRPSSAPHPVDQVPPFGKLTILGIQHVLAFYAVPWSSRSLSPPDSGSTTTRLSTSSTLTCSPVASPRLSSPQALVVSSA